MTSYLRINNQNIQELDPSKFMLAEKSLDVFTTFVTHKLDNKLGVLRLDLHLERIIKGAELLNIKFALENIDLLKSCLKKFLDRNSREKIRVIQRASGDLELQIEPYLAPWEKGAIIALKSHRSERALPEIKHTDLSICSLARKLAEQSGAQEGLLVSNTTQVLEGAWSNIFWVDKDNQLHSTKQNVLPGITRQIISELNHTNFSSISLEELKNSHEVFITQSTTGVTAINQIDASEIKTGSISKMISDKLDSYTFKNLTAIEDL